MTLNTTSARASGSHGKGVLSVALCVLAMIFEGFDLQAPGITMPVLTAAFDMTPNERALFLSMSTFGLMVGSLIGGRLSDWIGRKWVLIGSIALFGALSVVTALSTSVQMLMWARFITGIGFGGALPNLVAIAAESVSLERRSTAVGFLLAGPGIGGGLASLVAALASGPNQWPLVYYIGGLGPLLLVVPTLALFLPNYRVVRSTPDGITRPSSIPNILFGEGRAARTAAIWLGFFTILLVLFLLLGWLPSLLISRGLSRPDASLAQVAFNLSAIPGTILTGLLFDRFPKRTILLVFAATAAALAFLAASPGSFGIAVLAAFLAGATVTGAQAIIYALAPSCYPTVGRGTGMGFGVAVGRFGSAAGPLLAGSLIGAGQSPTRVLATLLPIVCVAGAAAMFAAWSMQRKSSEGIAGQPLEKSTAKISA